MDARTLRVFTDDDITVKMYSITYVSAYLSPSLVYVGLIFGSPQMRSLCARINVNGSIKLVVQFMPQFITIY